MFNLNPKMFNISKMSFFLILLCLPTMVLSDCGCEPEDAAKHDKSQTLKYRIGAIFAILMAGAVGILLPLISKKIPALSPQKDLFFMIKAFAAGVILSTGFIHILPDAFGDLTSGCLDPNPWQNFPFTGFIAMMAAIITLMIDSYATSYYKRMHNGKEENLHLHGHSHGSAMISEENGMSEVVRQRVVSQVLELGIVVHSVIIGISLGASQSLDTIKPLIGALSFHQFFEGIGLGGCISQAKFESLSTLIMAAFFSLTTPVGIAIGIGISSVYSETSKTSLIVEGCFNAAAAGILIYMALVDLLAADFMNPRMQNNVRLQLGSNISLLLGAGCMSVLAKWA